MVSNISPPSSSSSAILVRNAIKSYNGKDAVLQNLNMTVPSGAIYGLVGASGCGKTTLLSCILNFKRINSGTIRVFGQEPIMGGQDIGYQPQEVALYNHLTVEDTLFYFGRLLAMSSTEIGERIKYLTEALQLPESEQLVKNLSGGQQRRVSLAITLLKQPRLLILDEPTTGQDPVLVESIWNLLRDLVASSNLTILVTTHYYEEVKHAQTVGYLRNGRILVESSPNSVLLRTGTKYLADAFRILCENDENEIRITQTPQNPEIMSALEDAPKAKSLSSSLSRSLSSHCLIIWALILKTFLFLKRTPIYTVHIVLLPCIQIVNFIFILGLDPKGIQLGVVNSENCSAIVSTGASCLTEGMSCSFLAKFPGDEFQFIDYDSDVEALQGVQQGDSWGFVSIPRGYSGHLRDRAVTGRFSGNETIDGSSITGRLDLSHPLKADFLQFKLHSYFQSFLEDEAENCGQTRAVAELPLKYSAIYGSITSNLQPYLQPGFFALCIILLPMACAVRFLQDRKYGTLARSRVVGLTYSHIIAEWIISEGMILLVQVVSCYVVLAVVGGFTEIGATYLALIYLVGVVGSGIGFLVGQAFDSELEAIFVILGFYMPMTVASGANTPFDGMPYLAQLIYSTSPVAEPIKGLRSIATRGWGISHPKVWPAFAVPIIYILLLLLLSVIVIRIRNRK